MVSLVFMHENYLQRFSIGYSYPNLAMTHCNKLVEEWLVCPPKFYYFLYSEHYVGQIKSPTMVSIDIFKSPRKLSSTGLFIILGDQKTEANYDDANGLSIRPTNDGCQFLPQQLCKSVGSLTCNDGPGISANWNKQWYVLLSFSCSIS